MISQWHLETAVERYHRTKMSLAFLEAAVPPKKDAPDALPAGYPNGDVDGCSDRHQRATSSVQAAPPNPVNVDLLRVLLW